MSTKLFPIEHCQATYNHFWSFVLVMDLDNDINDSVLFTNEYDITTLTLFNKTGDKIADIHCGETGCIIGGRTGENAIFIVNDFDRVMKV